MIFEICISFAIFALVMALAYCLKAQRYAEDMSCELLADLALSVKALQEEVKMLEGKQAALSQSMDIWKEAVQDTTHALSDRLAQTKDDMDGLKKQYAELETALETAAENERRFQDGINNLLDYNVKTALGGGNG